jgi:4-hydroxybenzoate polyprenyltransferase
MNKKIISFIELARLDKPIGIYLLLWPSLLGLLLGAIQSQTTDFINYLIVIIGSILVRSCGCVINDISDSKIDKQVSRTLNRPLANGSISIIEAWLFFILLGILSTSLLIFTNSLTVKISIFFALLIMLYPLTKRFLKAPQFFLGITFGSGSLIAYSLQSSVFSISLAILYLGIIAWIISFDTYYALEDKDDDLKININSTAILWGDNAIKYAQILQILFYVSLFLIAVINEFSLYFYSVFVGLLMFFIYQTKLTKENKFIKCFKINNWIGILAVLGFSFQIFYLS